MTPYLRYTLPRSLAIASVIAVAATFSFPAHAQGPGGSRLSDADREAAWTLQAKGVAASLDLTMDEAVKVAEVYSASRSSLEAAVAKLADSGERGPGRFEAYRKAADEERAKLKAALAEFLSPDAAEKATATLGTFSRQWDRMANTLAGFGLEDEKLNKALELVAGYVVESDAAMREAFAQQDWQSVRTKAQESKSSLDTALAEVLSEEQLATWKTATTYRGNRGGGESGSEGRGDRRDDDDAGRQEG
ncbi:MAG: hypothetical protein AMXMBFR82_52450 [Candidatus Hydrogenedentota bacterium]